MKILYVTSEASPFLKTGGLGDVSEALPKALVKEGVDARIIMPLYANIPNELKNQMEFLGNFYVTMSWRKTYCGVFRSTVGNVIYYFIDNEQYYARSNTYGEYDDSERFAFFSKAVLDVLNFIDFFPDIIHINDWQTSLTPIYLDAFYRDDERYQNIKTVLSIHNIEFQGKYDPIILGSIFGLDVTFRPILMYDGNINLLKGGIESCDMITTVSKSYAEEILGNTHSHGLHHILIPRRYKLCGITNGIDTDIFNPQTDSVISNNYNYETIRFKSLNKKALQREMGLEINNNIPLIGMVTRLTTQKGIELLKEVSEEIANLPIQLIVLGTGDKVFEGFLHDWERNHHDKIRGYVGFSGSLAQRIYAGADMFLMPSLFEPCGLGQLIALRYGSVPIVRETGGLKDTVIPYNEYDETGNGFGFKNYSYEELLKITKYALTIYKNKNIWKKIVKNAMESDNSWEKSASEYIRLYDNLIKND